MAYAYKVVRATDKPGVYSSLYDVCPVPYRVGMKTVAPVGGLLCYSSKSDCFSEASEAAQGGRMLFRVRVSRPVNLPPRSIRNRAQDSFCPATTVG